MSVTFEKSDNTLTAFLSGEIDHHTAAAFRDSIDSEAEAMKPQMLVLDFGGIGFMDSSGIGLIMGRSRLTDEYGGTLEIHNPSPQIRKVLRHVGEKNLHETEALCRDASAVMASVREMIVGNGNKPNGCKQQVASTVADERDDRPDGYRT